MAEEPQEKPKSRLFARIAAILLFIALGAGAMYLNIYNLQKLAPPSDGKTLGEFAAKMPPPQHLAIVDDQDQKAIIWIGELARFPALPSGRSCYQFDLSGALVDWCTDTGEGHRLDRLADAALTQPTKTVEEVTKVLKPQAPKPAETAAK